MTIDTQNLDGLALNIGLKWTMLFHWRVRRSFHCHYKPSVRLFSGLGNMLCSLELCMNSFEEVYLVASRVALARLKTEEIWGLKASSG